MGNYSGLSMKASILCVSAWKVWTFWKIVFFQTEWNNKGEECGLLYTPKCEGSEWWGCLWALDGCDKAMIAAEEGERGGYGSRFAMFEFIEESGKDDDVPKRDKRL